MKRFIILALVLTPLALVAVDRLTSCPNACLEPPAIAAPEPPLPPRPTKARGSHLAVYAAAPAPGDDVQLVESPASATEERAVKNLTASIDEAVADWLAKSDVPRSWHAPRALVNRMVQGTPSVELIEQLEYGDLYQASVPVAFSRESKSAILQEYRRDVSARRMLQLGGGLAFVLACLAVVSGYIRTDEATKGYYTNRLRLAAAAAMGGAGVLLYQMLSRG